MQINNQGVVVNKSIYEIPKHAQHPDYNYDVFEVWTDENGDRRAAHLTSHVEEAAAIVTAEAHGLWLVVADNLILNQHPTTDLPEAGKFVVRSRDSKAHTLHTRDPKDVADLITLKTDPGKEFTMEDLEHAIQESDPVAYAKVFGEDRAKIERDSAAFHMHAFTPEAISKREIRRQKREAKTSDLVGRQKGQKAKKARG